MGANDAAEMLEVAKAENLSLERELTQVRRALAFAIDPSLIDDQGQVPYAIALTEPQLLTLATQLEQTLPIEGTSWWPALDPDLRQAFMIIRRLAADIVNEDRAGRGTER